MRAAPPSTPPRPTPPAMPSGNLCRAMASTNISSGCWRSMPPPRRWPETAAVPRRNSMPRAVPRGISRQPAPCTISIAGTNSPKAAADSITPAAKAVTASFHVSDIWLTQKPQPVPISVDPPMPSAAQNTESIRKTPSYCSPASYAAVREPVQKRRAGSPPTRRFTYSISSSDPRSRRGRSSRCTPTGETCASARRAPRRRRRSPR